MADEFRQLRLSTIMMFGSLEFMSLCPELILPQPVRGRRLGHHAEGARHGR